MRRLLTLLGAVVMALLIAAPMDAALGQPPPGQVGGPPPRAAPGGFFDFLFGPRPVRPPPQQQQPSTRRATRPSEPPVPVVQVTPKDANARKILVVGDFVAGGLAWGLDQTFAEEPKIAVIDKSNNSSGLVRDDFYDWNRELPTILNADQAGRRGRSHRRQRPAADADRQDPPDAAFGRLGKGLCRAASPP